MTQIAIMSRVVHWLVAQDEVVQASVLGLLSDEALGDIAQLLLKRLAAHASDTPPGTKRRSKSARQGSERGVPLLHQ
jgi:hypothetical protein